MKTLSILSLSILLAACGGGSSSSSDKEATQVVEQAPEVVMATYQLALEGCGDNIELSISDHTVDGSGESYKLLPEEGARLLIEGTGHDICINGDMAELTIVGSGHDVYVNGNIEVLIVDGSGQNVMVFGDVMSVDLSGKGQDIWLETVATYTDSGTGNGIMNISNAEL